MIRTSISILILCLYDIIETLIILISLISSLSLLSNPSIDTDFSSHMDVKSMTFLFLRIPYFLYFLCQSVCPWIQGCTSCTSSTFCTFCPICTFCKMHLHNLHIPPSIQPADSWIRSPWCSAGGPAACQVSQPGGSPPWSASRILPSYWLPPSRYHESDCGARTARRPRGRSEPNPKIGVCAWYWLPVDKP